MKLALCMAAVILVVLLLKPIVIEGYYESKAEADYKAAMMAHLYSIGGGKPIDEKTPPDVLIKMMAGWLVAYNKYAKATGTPPATLGQAETMFPQTYLESYNKAVSKK